MRPDSLLPMLALLVISAVAVSAESHEPTWAQGTFRPDGPPQRPVRKDAGESCVVDVVQAYLVNGSLSGSFDVDFRILVDGPCGHPIGTFAEEWIAHGTFDGSLDGDAVEATFTYTATVGAGGEVEGQIVFGQGLDGKLRVHGSFSDGRLSYEGSLAATQ